eukprot:scaffold122937_cov30-Tisochrysis_lutea.AAC.1
MDILRTTLAQLGRKSSRTFVEDVGRGNQSIGVTVAIFSGSSRCQSLMKAPRRNLARPVAMTAKTPTPTRAHTPRDDVHWLIQSGGGRSIDRTLHCILVT